MRNPVVAPRASKGSGPYSQGILAGGFVFVSGQGPLHPETGEIIGESIEEQADLTLQNIEHIVEAAGSSLDDVVKVTVYLADMSDFDQFNEVYKRYFSAPMPARTCVQAGLDNILVEIDAIALVSNNG
ncbi:RidA family protein [Paenibacillus solisilvae]|uniref:RidA family protein n=1 Tax=Paenibacillus solisilvae TaxID=2486751 RepID=A0ABW0W405_9BACL